MLNPFGVSITNTGWHDWGQVLASNRITLDLTQVFIAGDGYLSGPADAVPLLLNSSMAFSCLLMDKTTETGAGRLLVTGDTDMFTDQYMSQYAENRRFADGMAAWAIGPFSTLSGHVTLAQYVASPSTVTVPLKLYRNGVLADIADIHPDASGAYSATVLNLGACVAVAKPFQWLGVKQPLDTSKSVTADWNFNHNGDANNSNSVGLSDIGVVLLSFSTSGADNADLNGDGAVGLADLGIALVNFGLIGDTSP